MAGGAGAVKDMKRVSTDEYLLIRPVGHLLSFQAGRRDFAKALGRFFIMTRSLVSLTMLFTGRGFRSVRVATAGVVGMLVFSGCGGSSPAPRQAATAETQESAADACRRKLSTAIQRIQPLAMASQARRETLVSGLNSWLSSCAEDDVKNTRIGEANATLLSPAALRSASAVRYVESDSVYIRDCLLLKSLTESVWKQADAINSSGVATDRERIVRLFQHLIRNLALLKADEGRIPVGLYEALLTGRGSVDDRVWAFAEALRQRNIDSIVLKAATPGDPLSPELSKAADLLVGVVAGDEFLLFDPQRGTALPKSGDASPLTTDPAGLDAIAGDERWKSAAAFVVCHPAAFAPRMMVLQERMDATDSAVLYEELAGGTSEIRPLKVRLTDVVGSVWPAESITIWDVPEQRIAAAAALSEEQRQAMSLLMRPFDSPFERESLSVGDTLDDPNVNQAEMSEDQKLERRMMALQERMERINASSDELFGKPSRRLLEARIEQIMGNVDVGMIQALQQIRIASLQEKIELEVPFEEKKAMVVTVPLPQAILSVQRSAVGDTLYWISMCQMSRNDMGAAVATLRNYRRQYPEEKSVFPSMLNEAEALLQLDDVTSAAAVLREADTEANPERARVQWLLSRLAPAAVPAP